MATTALDHSTATWTKLRNGSWGVKGAFLSPNDSVVVVKRDGTRKAVVVDRIVWQGEDGACIASIRQASASRRPGVTRNHRSSRFACDECGDWVARGTTCWETGMLH